MEDQRAAQFIAQHDISKKLCELLQQAAADQSAKAHNTDTQVNS
jgi:hypothetical protein